MEKKIECYIGDLLIFEGTVRVDLLDEEKIMNFISLSLNRGTKYIEQIGTIACDRYEIKEVK